MHDHDKNRKPFGKDMTPEEAYNGLYEANLLALKEDLSLSLSEYYALLSNGILLDEDKESIEKKFLLSRYSTSSESIKRKQRFNKLFGLTP